LGKFCNSGANRLIQDNSNTKEKEEEKADVSSGEVSCSLIP